jgi:hypothetical protein
LLIAILHDDYGRACGVTEKDYLSVSWDGPIPIRQLEEIAFIFKQRCRSLKTTGEKRVNPMGLMKKI